MWSTHTCQSLFSRMLTRCNRIRWTRYVIRLIYNGTRETHLDKTALRRPQSPKSKSNGIKAEQAEFQFWTDRSRCPIRRSRRSHPRIGKVFLLSCAGRNPTSGKLKWIIMRQQELTRPSYATIATDLIIGCIVSRRTLEWSIAKNGSSSVLPALEGSQTVSIWTDI